MPKILTIASLKGGVAKSSLAVNVAGIAATEHAKRVLLLDLDENRGSSEWFDADDAPFDVRATSSSAKGLSRLRDLTDYDLVVVDLPGFRGQALLDLVETAASDLMLIPARANPLDVKPLRSLVPALTTPYLVAFTMATPGHDPDVDAYREAFTKAGWSVARTTIHQSKGWPRAAQEQRLVTTGTAFPTARTDARELTRELLEALDG